MTLHRTTSAAINARVKQRKRHPNREKRTRGGSRDGGVQGSPQSSVAAAEQDVDNEKDIIWEEMFEELRAIKTKTGTCNLPDKKGRLAKWVYAQRKAFRRLQFSRGTPNTRARLAKLESIGFEFASSSYVSWDAMFEKYKNRKDISSADEARKLKLWMSNQRLEYSRKRRGLANNITQGRIAKLNSVGFQWVGRTGKPFASSSGKRSHCKDDDESRQKKSSKKPKRQEIDGSNQSNVSHQANAITCMACAKRQSEAVVSPHNSTHKENENNDKNEIPANAVSARDHQELEEAGAFLECLVSLKHGVTTTQANTSIIGAADSRDNVMQNENLNVPINMTRSEDSGSATCTEDAEDDDSGIREEEYSETESDEMESETSSSRGEQVPSVIHDGGCGGNGSFASLQGHQYNTMKNASEPRESSACAEQSVPTSFSSYGTIPVAHRANNGVVNASNFHNPAAITFESVCNGLPFANCSNNNSNMSNHYNRVMTSALHNSVGTGIGHNVSGIGHNVSGNVVQAQCGAQVQMCMNNPGAIVFHQQLPTSVTVTTMPSIAQAGMFGPSYLSSVPVQQYVQLSIGQPRSPDVYFMLPAQGCHVGLPQNVHHHGTLINRQSLLSTLPRGAVVENHCGNFPTITHFIHPR